MKIKTLGKKEKKQFEKKLKDRFGIKIPSAQFIRGGKDKLRLFTGDFSEHELNILNGIVRIETIGMRYGSFDKNKDFRIGFDASNLFTPKRNIITLDKKQLKTWFQGQDLDIKVKKQGYVVLRFENIIVGCGKATQNKILNFVPKERRS
jgi:NOL1/NOP2/fmu family ribosome biogenesis protein